MNSDTPAPPDTTTPEPGLEDPIETRAELCTIAAVSASCPRCGHPGWWADPRAVKVAEGGGAFPSKCGACGQKLSVKRYLVETPNQGMNRHMRRAALKRVK